QATALPAEKARRRVGLPAVWTGQAGVAGDAPGGAGDAGDAAALRDPVVPGQGRAAVGAEPVRAEGDGAGALRAVGAGHRGTPPLGTSPWSCTGPGARLNVGEAGRPTPTGGPQPMEASFAVVRKNGGTLSWCRHLCRRTRCVGSQKSRGTQDRGGPP